jgi:1,4-dihydroxy-2-naphthoate octaprenyltransferase
MKSGDRRTDDDNDSSSYTKQQEKQNDRSIAMTAENFVSTIPEQDPVTFFQGHSSSETIAFARKQAEKVRPPSIVYMWLSAVQIPFTGWALLPISIAGAFTWLMTQHVSIAPLIFLAISSVLILSGTYLLRNASESVKGGRIQGTDLPTFVAARAAIGFIASGLLLMMISIMPHIGPVGILLTLLGIILAVGYGFLPTVYGSFPAEEAVISLVMGPGLFMLALLTQKGREIPLTTITGKKSQTTITIVSLLTPATWLIAIGLGFIIFAAILVIRMGHEDIATNSLQTILGDQNTRWLFATSILAAYVCIIIAGLQPVYHFSVAPHAILSALLSIPLAVIPVTGVLSAHNSVALRAISTQTQRLVWYFGAWILAGLILGSLYLNILARFK